MPAMQKERKKGEALEMKRTILGGKTKFGRKFVEVKKFLIPCLKFQISSCLRFLHF